MEETIQEVQLQRIVLGDWFQAPLKSRYIHVVLVNNYGLLYRRVKALADIEKRANAGTEENHAIDPKSYFQYDRLLFKDIVGCQCMRDPIKPRTQRNGSGSQEPKVQNGTRHAYLCIYAYPLRKKPFRKGLKRQRQTLTLGVNRCNTYEENAAIVEKWEAEIHAALNVAATRPDAGRGGRTSRKLLVFVSPKSGPGKALSIFQQRVAPILGEASIAYDLIVTERKDHAKDYIKSADLSHWDGIVTVAGDGVMYEIVNGIMERADWRKTIKTPIGVVPGGSGNGLSRSIAHAVKEPPDTNLVLLSAFHVAKAKLVPMDLVRVQTTKGTLYSFLSIGWGIMADIDIESERLRALGESRFTVWALHRIARPKLYKGRLSYLPVPDYKPTKIARRRKRPVMHRAKSTYAKKQQAPQRPLASSTSLPGNLDVLGDGDENSDEDNRASNRISLAVDALAASELQVDEELHSMPNPTPQPPGGPTEHASVLPLLGAPVPEDWVQCEEEFVLVYVLYQSHIGTELFMAPEATMDDGVMWMVIIRKGASRAQLTKFMLSLESGTHAEQSFVEMLPIKAFRLEPITEGGHLTVDGELIEYGPIQAEVMPSAARIMAH